MSANVIPFALGALAGRPSPQPQAQADSDMVDTLAELLRKARRGELKAMAFCAIDTSNRPITGLAGRKKECAEAISGAMSELFWHL